MTHPDVFQLATIATAHGVRARLVTDDWSQIADERELQGIREWLDSDTNGLSRLLAALVHPETVEGWDVGDLTAAAYGQLDLGTHCIVSGGEIMELGTQEGSDA